MGIGSSAPEASSSADNGAVDVETSAELPPSTRAEPIGTPANHPVRPGVDVESEEEDLLEEEAGASSVSSVFTMCNSAIGAGVLSLPYAFRCAGALGCLLLCVALGLFQSLTLYVLSKFAERYDATNYSILVRRALGRKLSAALSCTLVIYQLGSCSAYLIIVGDTFGQLLAQALGQDSWLAQRDLVITFFAVCIILPMCFPRNLSSLHWISTAGVCGFLYSAVVIMYEGAKIVHHKPDPWEHVHLFKLNFEALFAIPIIVFGFNCHANVVSVFNELGERPRVLVGGLPREPADYRQQGASFMSSALGPKPRTSKLIGMISVILATVAVIMAGYLAVGCAGYLAYPTTVSSNVLKTFPDGPLPLKIARAAIGCVVVGHYPLNAHPARVGLEHLEAYYFGWKNLSAAFAALQTAVFVGVTLSIALVVTDLGAVLHLIGGTAAAFIIFFLPGLLLVNAAIVKLHAPPGHTPTASGDLDALETEQPLLADRHERGIKRTGLIYSPRRSWWLGIAFVTLSVFIFIITVATQLFHP